MLAPTRACSGSACPALRVLVCARAWAWACWRCASLGLRLRIADSGTEIWFASFEFALATAQDASFGFDVAMYNANRTYSDLVWSTAKPKFGTVPKTRPKVGLDLETALAKSIPNSAALGMKLQSIKVNFYAQNRGFGNGFRFCKTQFCAQNLGVELTFDFCTLKVFSLEVFSLEV